MSYRSLLPGYNIFSSIHMLCSEHYHRVLPSAVTDSYQMTDSCQYKITHIARDTAEEWQVLLLSCASLAR